MWSMKFGFLLNYVSLVYDIHYVLKDGSVGDGTILIKYKHINFDISINGNNTDKSITTEIVQMGVNKGATNRGQREIEIKAHPWTPQIQVICSQVR